MRYYVIYLGDIDMADTIMNILEDGDPVIMDRDEDEILQGSSMLEVVLNFCGDEERMNWYKKYPPENERMTYIPSETSSNEGYLIFREDLANKLKEKA